ncbi:contractile injection system tape measure protein [Moorena producens]|uniref:contractile injection system tape measure protein n=1 Tax=Moorena producens TaxID=1155739 RepID=UPI003C72B6C1
MNQQRHIIKKQIIELNLSSQQGAFELQNEVSRLYRRKVLPLIDNLFNQFSDLDTIHRINTLEIDLGNIDINNLEQELIEKIIAQIQQQLEEQISRSTSSFSTQPQPKTELGESSPLLRRTEGETGENIEVNKFTSVNATSYQKPSDQIGRSEIASKSALQLEILSYFIQTGMLPWWAEKLSKQELEDYCDRLITNSPNQVKSIVEQSLKNPKQLQRLIFQFSDSTLLKIAGLLTGDLVPFIADYNTDIKPVLEQLEQTRNIPEAKLRLEMWQGILFSLYSESNTKVDKLKLIEENLLHIATSNRINYPELLTNLVAKIEHLVRAGKDFKSRLPEILDRIQIPSQDAQLIRAEERASQLEIFSDFIQTGILPENLSKQELEDYCDRLITNSPNQVKSIVEQSLKNPKHLQRLIYQISDSTLLKIAGLFTGDSVQFIADYNTDIKSVLAQLEQTRNIPAPKLRLERWQGILFSISSESNTKVDKFRLIQDNLLHIASSNNINYPEFLTNLVAKIEDLVRAGKGFKSRLPEILDRIQIPSQDTQLIRAEERASQLEIFSDFIQTGILPENVSKQDLEQYCVRLITNSPNQVKSIVEQSLKNTKQLQRLIYQFSDSTLLKIAGLFTTDSVQFIADYNTDIKPVLAQLEQTRNIPEAKLRLEIWQGILLSISSESKTQVDKFKLIEDNLLHIASSNNINYPELLTNLVAKIEHLVRQGKKFKSRLPEILDRIQIPSQETQLIRAEARASQLEIFSDFIQTGILPENFSKQELEHYCDRLITNSPNQVKSIVKLCFKNPKHLQRLIYQFSDSTLLKIAGLFTGNLVQFIADYNTDIKPVLEQLEQTRNIPEAKLRLEIWQGLLLSICSESNTKVDKFRLIEANLLHITSSNRINYPEFLTNIVAKIEHLVRQGKDFKSTLPEILDRIKIPSQETQFIKEREQLKHLVRELQHLDFNSQILPQHKQQINQLKNEIEILLNQINNPAQAQRSSDLITRFKQLQKSFQTLKLNIQQELKSNQTTISDAVNAFSDSDEIYIYNAGLILLWPFMTRFFVKIGLVKDKIFINTTSAERAALLLQYLVDNSTEIPEHSLPLNKILCGIDLLEPIDTNLEITAQEREECENLLSAVIQNWSILKNTSIEGFRKAFLQRNGIVRVRDGSWLLQVERETYDILLDRIPWSIRVVKLPWMDNILYVEW